MCLLEVMESNGLESKQQRNKAGKAAIKCLHPQPLSRHTELFEYRWYFRVLWKLSLVFTVVTLPSSLPLNVAQAGSRKKNT